MSFGFLLKSKQDFVKFSEEIANGIRVDGDFSIFQGFQMRYRILLKHFPGHNFAQGGAMAELLVSKEPKFYASS